MRRHRRRSCRRAGPRQGRLPRCSGSRNPPPACRWLRAAAGPSRTFVPSRGTLRSAACDGVVPVPPKWRDIEHKRVSHLFHLKTRCDSKFCLPAKRGTGLSRSQVKGTAAKQKGLAETSLKGRRDLHHYETVCRLLKLYQPIKWIKASSSVPPPG